MLMPHVEEACAICSKSCIKYEFGVLRIKCLTASRGLHL